MATVDRASTGAQGSNPELTPGSNTASAAAASVGSSAAAGTLTLARRTVPLSEQNASGLNGTATITDLGGGQTRVELSFTGDTGNRPAHIHDGTCANLNPAPRYPLSNVINGTSTTEVPASLAELEQGTFAVNVHMSPEQANIYVACGDLR